MMERDLPSQKQRDAIDEVTQTECDQNLYCKYILCQKKSTMEYNTGPIAACFEIVERYQETEMDDQPQMSSLEENPPRQHVEI